MIRSTNGFAVGIDGESIVIIQDDGDESKMLYLTKHEVPLFVRLVSEALIELEGADD